MMGEEEEDDDDGLLMPLMKLFPPRFGGWALMAAPQTACYWHCGFFHPFEPALEAEKPPFTP